MNLFDIPVVLLVFKRYDKIKLIIDKLKEIQPKKLYIIADGPRNEKEKEETDKCRETIENMITWNCEIIKNYAEKNRGVYANIAEGAKWVFEREKWAIFLEDDNLPEVSFFNFCEELLRKYENDTRVLWICGTNYLQEYQPEDGSSYVFTKHLLPCGWASWSNKFLEFYDGNLELLDDKSLIKRMEKEYYNRKLYKQQIELARRERERIKKGLNPISWDYQMEFALRANNLYGISPKYNQIENIGVDNNSIHGGTSLNNAMTKRFCTIKTRALEFPIIHPKTLIMDKEYEKKVSKIILYPYTQRFKMKLSKIIRKILGIKNTDISIKDYIKTKI